MDLTLFYNKFWNFTTGWLKSCDKKLLIIICQFKKLVRAEFRQISLTEISIGKPWWISPLDILNLASTCLWVAAVRFQFVLLGGAFHRNLQDFQNSDRCRESWESLWDHPAGANSIKYISMKHGRRPHQFFGCRAERQNKNAENVQREHQNKEKKFPCSAFLRDFSFCQDRLNSMRLSLGSASHRIQWDSNPRPFDREANTLPSELPCFGKKWSFSYYF